MCNAPVGPNKKEVWVEAVEVSAENEVEERDVEDATDCGSCV